MRHDGVVVAAVSLAWGLVVAAAAYAITRAIQSLLFPDPNPSSVIWSAHAGYYWRIWTVSYMGGVATFVVHLVACRRVESWAGALVPAMGIAAVLLVLQAALFP